MKYFQEKVPAFQAGPDGREVPSVKISIDLAGKEPEGKAARREQVQLREEEAAEWEAAEAAERFDHEEAEEVGGGEAPPVEQGRHAAHH